jgi:hypothetical protein
MMQKFIVANHAKNQQKQLVATLGTKQAYNCQTLAQDIM